MSTAPVGNTSLASFDVIVLGSGSGGSAVTYMAAKSGLKVLVLEAGSNWFDGLGTSSGPVCRFSNDELKFSTRDFIYPNPLVEPRTWRNTDQDGDRLYTGDVNGLPKTVGGGAVHADLKTPRFEPQDFHLGTELGSVSGANFADWPIDYDVLEPYYLYAEHKMGVQGIAGANPFEGPRSGPFPMPPGVPMYGPLLAAQGATKLGYAPFPFPTGVNSQPYDGRPACVDCGLCSGFGCPSNAKGSPAVTTLHKALATGNCLLLPGTRAIKLLVNGSKNQIVGVQALDPQGHAQTYVGDRYVLSMSPIEDARLLLMSDPGGVGIGNSSGYVGRNLTFHLQTNAVGVFDQRVHGHRGRTVTHAIADFRGVPNDPNHPLGGIVELSGSEGPIEEAGYLMEVLGALGAWTGPLFKRLLRQSPARDRVVALTMQGEDAPQLTNRVDLDPAVKDLDNLPVPRITYQSHPMDLAASQFYGPKLVEILGAGGAHYAFVAPPTQYGLPTSAHIMGTLRFGTDPKLSVCNPVGQFHDVGNLYGADGCLFPTASGFNPTLTIIALSMWVGANIVNPSAPNSELT
jgi:choline dehydrogenase-like flavoprotein